MDASARPQVGTASNRYIVLGRLAGGGMADIFLARSISEAGIERHVVLKRVLAERSRDPHFAALFLDEARIAAQLQHPNIAQVLDVGKLAGSYFFTMEYVHGEDVRHLLHRSVAASRELPIASALSIAAGVLAGLHHAHTRTSTSGTPLHVVHRDVSPSNVMVSYEGGVKLLDFGVAMAAERTSESSAGTVKGKVGYASPEQCRGERLDRRSDIYSAGIVLWEMLVSRRLYKYESDYATMNAIVTQPVRPPSQLRAGVSPELDAVVLRALDKDRERRFQTAADLLDAIEQLAAREAHVLSATGLGRLLRELFGERPEPWLELARGTPETEVTVTVTGEAVEMLDTDASIAIQPSGAHPQTDQALASQLERAPQLGRVPQSSSATMPPVFRARTSTGTGTGEPLAPPRSRRAIVIVSVAAMVVVVIAAFATLATKRDKLHARSFDAGAASSSSATPPAAAPADAPGAIAVDAGVPSSVSAATVPDAAVVTPASTTRLDAGESSPVVAPGRHVRPADPCRDQHYRDENPLKCQ